MTDRLEALDAFIDQQRDRRMAIDKARGIRNWDCSICHFTHHGTTEMCQVCGQKRPFDVAPLTVDFGT